MLSCEEQNNKLLSLERTKGKGRLSSAIVHSYLASMCAIVTFRVSHNVRGEARPGSHTAKTYSKHVSYAHTSMSYKRTVLMAGGSLGKSVGLVGCLGSTLEALQIRAFRGTPRGC
jgi:hypothetical protein